MQPRQPDAFEHIGTSFMQHDAVLHDDDDALDELYAPLYKYLDATVYDSHKQHKSTVENYFNKHYEYFSRFARYFETLEWRNSIACDVHGVACRLQHFASGRGQYENVETDHAAASEDGHAEINSCTAACAHPRTALPTSAGTESPCPWRNESAKWLLLSPALFDEDGSQFL